MMHHLTGATTVRCGSTTWHPDDASFDAGRMTCGACVDAYRAAVDLLGPLLASLSRPKSRRLKAAR